MNTEVTELKRMRAQQLTQVGVDDAPSPSNIGIKMAFRCCPSTVASVRRVPERMVAAVGLLIYEQWQRQSYRLQENKIK